jgi:hypothetical protein
MRPAAEQFHYRDAIAPDLNMLSDPVSVARVGLVAGVCFALQPVAQAAS